jgi:uncharacterized membrane protein
MSLAAENAPSSAAPATLSTRLRFAFGGAALLAGAAVAAVNLSAASLHAPDFSVLASRTFATQIHVVSAIAALALGPIVLWRRKGDAMHKAMGRVWALAMAVVCASSFFMESFAPLAGQFGAIHILSVVTAVQLPRAIWLARAGRIAEHQRAMRLLFAGLLTAGLFTMIPGRVMFETFFG